MLTADYILDLHDDSKRYFGVRKCYEKTKEERDEKLRLVKLAKGLTPKQMYKKSLELGLNGNRLQALTREFKAGRI